VPVCPGTPERRGSAAAESGSDAGADAVGSRLQPNVRHRLYWRAIALL
jgi:hypothetical protein